MRRTNFKKQCKFAIAAILAMACCLALAGCARTPEAKEARYLASGKKLVEKKDYARALIQFRNASKVMPKDAEPYYQAGLVYIAMHEWQAAYNSLQGAVTLNHNHQQARLKMAELLALSSQKDQIQQAEQTVQDLIKSAPTNAEELDVLAMTEWKLGNQQDAEKHLEEAFANFPAHLTSAVNLARVKMSHKDFAGAEEVLKKTAEQKPPSVGAILALGQFYVSTGKISDGEKQFRRAVEIDPKSGPALLSLAVLQVRTSKLQDADQTYQKLSALPEPQYRPYHAVFLAALGKHDQAAGELEKLNRQYPDDRSVRSYLVGELIRLGKKQDAEAVVASAVKKSPKDVDARLLRASIYLATGRPDDAQKDLAEALHFRPDSYQAHYLMAQVHRARGAAMQQRQELGEVLRLRKDYLPARLQLARALVGSGSAQAALDLLDDRDVPQQQKTNLQYIVQRNWALIVLNRTEDARKELDRAMAQVKAPELLFQDASLKYSQKNYTAARTSLVEALNKSPEDLRMLRLLVATFAAEKRPAEAVRTIQDYAAQHPKSVPVQQFLAELLMANGQRDQARAILQTIKAANPRWAPADLALAQLDLADGKLNDANKGLTAVLVEQPNNLAARLMLATVEEKAGNHPAAIADYKKVLETQPNSVFALNNLAFDLAEYTNQPDEALKYAQKAAELAPDTPAVENTLGWVLYRKGLYSVALPHLEKADNQEPSARRKCHVALAYLKLGDQERGEKYLQAAIKMDPNLPEIRMAQQLLEGMQNAR